MISNVIRNRKLNMSKVVLKGHIIVQDSDLVAVKKELITHKELTCQEDGCLVFEVTQDEENLNKFNVYEEFIDQDSFAAHQTRVRESNWGTITINVERHYQITGAE